MVRVHWGAPTERKTAMEKVYVVVRGDLSPGALCAQSCHALSAFAADFPAAHAAWHRQGQNLVVLQVPREPDLVRLLEAALESEEIDRVSLFREPDLNHQLTAIALDGKASRLVSSLPLALRQLRAS